MRRVVVNEKRTPDAAPEASGNVGLDSLRAELERAHLASLRECETGCVLAIARAMLDCSRAEPQLDAARAGKLIGDMAYAACRQLCLQNGLPLAWAEHTSRQWCCEAAEIAEAMIRAGGAS